MGARVLFSYLKKYHLDLIESLGSIILINPEADLNTLYELYPYIITRVQSITIYCDGKDTALYWADIANCSRTFFNNAFHNKSSMSYETGMGRNIVEPLRDSDGNLLSIDVINAGSVHGNVAEVRHCYFSLSREVIEDIREHIVESKSALSRVSRLIKREGNIYDFLIAPPYVLH